MRTSRSLAQRGVFIGAAFALTLAACSKGDEQPAAGASQPAVASASTTGVTPDLSAKADEVRILPVSVQGVAPVGVTVRVKSVELGLDATILDVSASYAGTTTSNVDLASAPTYLETESGERLMLKRPDNNRDLKIHEGDTMDGKLVFLGRVPSTAKQVQLVFNEGNDGSDIIGPGLVMIIPLTPAAS